jgi:hypothetical protein
VRPANLANVKQSRTSGVSPSHSSIHATGPELQTTFTGAIPSRSNEPDHGPALFGQPDCYLRFCSIAVCSRERWPILAFATDDTGAVANCTNLQCVKVSAPSAQRARRFLTLHNHRTSASPAYRPPLRPNLRARARWFQLVRGMNLDSERRSSTESLASGGIRYDFRLIGDPSSAQK